MSLIHFHRFLIATAILFCGGFALREFGAVAGGGGATTFAIGTIFTIFAVGLVVYLINLQRFLGGHNGGASSR
jgi:hypothetical protein